MTTFEKNLVSAVQERLADLGYYRLRIDGAPGPGTSDAVVRFKQAHGLRARDFVGAQTLTMMFSPTAKIAPKPKAVEGEPPWLAEARSLLGIRETPGAGNTAEIMRWAKDLDQWYPGDDVPWCGLFVARCMAAGAPHEPQNFNRLGARAWRSFGVEWTGSMVPLGGIAVFWRTHKTKSVNGHVAIITGHSSDALRVIGGNQSDAVTETWISRERLLSIQLPHGYQPAAAPVARTGALSTNEA